MWLTSVEAPQEGNCPAHLPPLGTDTQSSCSQVQPGGPADKAGLENEDVIVEVNGENVQDEPYDTVVGRIKSSGERVTLLVCGKVAYSYFQARKIPIVSAMADPLVAGPDDKGETSADHPARERVSVAVQWPCLPGLVPASASCFPVLPSDTGWPTCQGFVEQEVV